MAAPTLTISPDGGRFTVDTLVTITASRSCTIYWSVWPDGSWQHTANATQVQVTLTQSGTVRAFAVATDTGEITQTDPANGLPAKNFKQVAPFIINKPGAPVSVFETFRSYALLSDLTDQPDWGPVPGVPYSPMLNVLINGEGSPYKYAERAADRGTQAGRPAGDAAAIWAGDTFGPDQEIIGSNDPPYEAGITEHIVARMSLTETGFTGYLAGVGYFLDVPPELYVWRRNADGTDTVLAAVEAPEHHGDYWFHFLRVWGGNPVHIQAGIYVPDVWVPTQEPGSPASFRDWDGDGEADEPRFGREISAWHPVPEALPGNTFIYWEGVDASAGRLATGQPGMWFAEGASFQFAHFIAREILAPAIDVGGQVADLSLAALAGAVTKQSTVTNRLILPGAMKIWDGTQYVNAPVRLFDGSNFS
jgi:hypothetical protein